MRTILFLIPTELAGIPVFGVGWLLAAWLVFAAVLLGHTAWKRGVGSEFWGHVPLLVLVGAIITWVLPAVAKPEGLPIRGWGSMVLLAVVAATVLMVYRARRLGLEADPVFSLVFWMYLFGIVGARAFFVIEYWPDFQKPTLGATLAAIVNFTEGGMVVLGSLIGGMLGMVIFVRRHGWPILAVCDLLAPSLMLGVAIGRIGCLLNGCCFGGPCDQSWAITFPPESPPYWSQLERGSLYGMTFVRDEEKRLILPPTIESVTPGGPADSAGLREGDRLARINGNPLGENDPTVYWQLADVAMKTPPVERLVIETTDGRRLEMPVAQRSLPTSPTQPISSLNAAVLFVFLMAYAPFRRRDGELFAVLLTLYPITRFLLEIIRTDETGVWGLGLSISQVGSLVLLAGVAVLWAVVLRQPRGSLARWPVGPATPSPGA
ncbi:MAG: prolipoprotein diacylglyceryl transferase [Pirellulales bacterium]|nr:prolipoprotein diacylglyceryl transferase [Pirellulales bacterium]